MYKNGKTGISPVIGVILLVAVTVALVSLATVIVFDVGDDVSESSDITVQVEQINEGINFNVIRNDNVVDIRVNGPDGYEETFDANIGNSHQIIEGEGEYTVVAILDDNNTELISSKIVSEDTELISGTVEFNPPVEGVNVTSIDSDGDKLDYDITNQDGEYSVKKGETIKVNNHEVEPNENNTIQLTEISDENDENIVDMIMDKNDDGIYQIESASQLQAVNEKPDENYELSNDINASHTKNWNLLKKQGEDISETVGNRVGDDIGDRIHVSYTIQDVLSIYDTEDDSEVTEYTIIDKDEGIIELNEETESEINITYNLNETHYKGFKPIGDRDTMFEDEFDGNEYKINNLYIDRPQERWIGLFGYVESGSLIKNVNVNNVNIIGDSNTGGLIGRLNNRANVENTSVTGNIYGTNSNTGGLIGQNRGNIENSYSIATVKSIDSNTGGLIGRNRGDIENSYSIATVKNSESNFIGGFVGRGNGNIENSYAKGDVVGNDRVGGFAGLDNGNIKESYSTANVIGNDGVGGLVGINRDSTVSESYATGSVTGDEDVGGLVGGNLLDATVSESYWDTESSGKDSSDGGTGLTTDEMQGGDAETNMSELFPPFETTDEYPILQWQE